MLKPTKHATTNYRMLKPYLDAADAHGGHARFLAGELMPLVVENLGYTFRGGQVYSVTNYGELNGDLMRDPDLTLSVNHASGTVDPLTFQNDYMGRYEEVYLTNEAGQERYRPYLRTDLDGFLWQWLKESITICYDPANIDRSRDDAPEDDDFPDADPAAIRAKLESGESDAFVARVFADAAAIAAEDAPDGTQLSILAG